MVTASARPNLKLTPILDGTQDAVVGISGMQCDGEDNASLLLAFTHSNELEIPQQMCQHQLHHNHRVALAQTAASSRHEGNKRGGVDLRFAITCPSLGLETGRIGKELCTATHIER